jgi:hypothetical protein
MLPVNSIINDQAHHDAILGGNPLKKQQKKGRPRLENPMVHTAVVLPRALLEQLRMDAERSERGLSAEIRQRLQSTYGLEGLPDDPETNDLIVSIKSLAHNLASDLGKKWHETEYGLAAFRNGVMTFFSQYAPKGDEGVRKFGNADTIGGTHARLILAARRAEEKK